MKKVTLIIVAGLLLLCLGAEAQFIVEPCAEGTATWVAFRSAWFTSYGAGHYQSWDRYEATDSTLRAGWNYSDEPWGSGYSGGNASMLTHYQPVIEFNLADDGSGTGLPLSLMTWNNFSAHLVGIEANVIQGQGCSHSIELYRIRPPENDCVISPSDHDGYNPDFSYITDIWDPLPSGQVTVEPIDVTRALRTTLFTHASDNVAFAIDNWDFEVNCDEVNIPLAMNSIKLEVNIDETKIPTPTPTHTPTPTPSVLPAKLDLQLSQNHFVPGDNFSLVMVIESKGLPSIVHPVCLTFEAMGQYFFFPDWSDEFETAGIVIDKQYTIINVMDFEWPETNSSGSDFHFHAVILTHDLKKISSNIDSVSFGWDG